MIIAKLSFYIIIGINLISGYILWKTNREPILDALLNDAEKNTDK